VKRTGREISLHEINHRNIKDAGKCDGTFVVNSRLAISSDERGIRTSIVPTTPYQKTYPVEPVDYHDYIDHPDKTVFLAYLEDVIAGEIRLRKNWNHYAYVEDIVVDAGFRRRGIGRSLIHKAIQWAKEKSLPGIMLETQNNNVAGCSLYRSFGFELAGFDRRVYQGINPQTDEIALYWYLIFDSRGVPKK
jgi:streptothricin acetyltransferase